MARRRGLGRGLDALLEVETLGLREVPVGELRPNRYQPRTDFDEDGLTELAESIRSQGIVQPLVVTPADGGFVIIAGERRWRAARRAGLTEVPVVVREVDGDQHLLELALVENLQRADLNPIEEAEAYKSLGKSFGLTHEEIGRRVGKSRAAITNNLRLLKLPPEIQDMLRDGRLRSGQARPLATLPQEDALRLAERAARDGLSARRLEQLAAAGPTRRRAATVDPDTREAAQKLTRELQTKVEIKRRGRGGTVVLHFHDEEGLMRLFDHLTGKGNTMSKDHARGDLNGFLDAGSHINGELHFEDTFRIDGKVTGKVVSKGDLVVGEQGQVEGEIAVGQVFVSGVVRGRITASRRAELTAGGKVYADIEAPALVIEEGAFFEGSAKMQAKDSKIRRLTAGNEAAKS